MPLMRATADWYNADHEGQVERGQEFETSEYRATELEMAGLAVRALSEKKPTRVVADEPEDDEDEPEDDDDDDEKKAPRKAAAKKKR
jgi:hypothetical protein